MKNLIKDVKLQLAIKSLVANGSVKNVEIAAEGNSLTIGEILFNDNNKDSKINVSFNKEASGALEVLGDHDVTVEIKDFAIIGNKGQKFAIEHLTLNSVGEAMELLSSLTK